MNEHERQAYDAMVALAQERAARINDLEAAVSDVLDIVDDPQIDVGSQAWSDAIEHLRAVEEEGEA